MPLPMLASLLAIFWGKYLQKHSTLPWGTVMQAPPSSVCRQWCHHRVTYPAIPSSPNTSLPPLFYSSVISSPMLGNGSPPNPSPAPGHRSPGTAMRPTLPIVGTQSSTDPAVPPLPAAHHNGSAALRKGQEHNEAASTALFREQSQLLGKKGRRKKKKGNPPLSPPPIIKK